MVQIWNQQQHIFVSFGFPALVSGVFVVSWRSARELKKSSQQSVYRRETLQ